MADEVKLAKAVEGTIARYLERRGRSLMTLAKAAGVGYTTVRRIAQGECIPNQETTLAIIDVTLEPREKIVFLKEHFPRIGKIMEESYPEGTTSGPNSEVERQMLQDECHCLVFNLAAVRPSGTTREQIGRVAGERGLVALDELVDQDILQTSADGRITYGRESWAVSNVNDLLTQIRHSLTYFNKELLGTEGSKLMHATGSVNHKALREIHGIVNDFIVKISHVKNHPFSQGDIPFFADFAMSLYDKKQFLEGGDS